VTAEALLARLYELGVSAEPRPDGGLAIAPASVVPPDLLVELRAAKAELLRLLNAAGVTCQAAGPPAPCPACGAGRWWRLSALEPPGPGPWRCGRCDPYSTDAWIDACTMPEGRA
jgi:hypothetical protein